MSASHDLGRMPPWGAPYLRSLALPAGLRTVLERGLALGHGEVVLRAPHGNGRIFLAEGAIAWVVAPDVTERLGHLMERRGVLSRSLLRSVVAKCAVTGANLAETLVSLGLVDRSVMRDTLLEHNARQLLQLLSLGNGVQVDHSPVRRAYASDLCFSLDELMERAQQLYTERPVSGMFERVPEQSGDRRKLPSPIAVQRAVVAERCLERLAALSVLRACVVVERATGRVLGSRSSDATPAVDVQVLADGAVALLELGERQFEGPAESPDSAREGERLEDIISSFGPFEQLVRAFEPGRELVCCVLLDRPRGNLGLTRIELRAATAPEAV